MKRLATLFTCSYRTLRPATTMVRTVTVCAMLGAVAIILGTVGSIQLTDTVRIGFSGIPNQLADYLFGPVVGSLFAGAMDILKYILKPAGPFFPGLTLVTMLAGVIYGCFYYMKPITIWRVLAAHFVVCLVCNVVLNSLCLSVILHKGILFLLPERIIKNIIMWPIDSLIFYHVAKTLEAAGIFRGLRQTGKK